MDKTRLKEIIDSSNDDVNSLYDRFVIIDKEHSDFNEQYLNELLLLYMYLFHMQSGIETISEKIKIPKLFIKVDSVEEFNSLLEKYSQITIHDPVLGDISALDKIVDLVNNKLFQRYDSWIKIYSSLIYKEEFNFEGKIYVSVDNKDLHQFAYLLLSSCTENEINDFEFKVNDDSSINRTDNVVIYFTRENLNKYLEIIERIKQNYPEIQINQCHILGEKLSNGVVIAKDYENYTSFTDKICKLIVELKKNNIPSEVIVEKISGEVSNHLEPIIAQLNHGYTKQNRK